MKILFSWIGRQDIVSASRDEDAAIAVAVRKINPDRIVLLNNFGDEEVNNFIARLKRLTLSEVKVVPVRLTSPTFHEEIYSGVLETVEREKSKFPEEELIFHLSPGTPAMHAVWILISKTKVNAQLIETTQERGLRFVNLPFDLSLEFYKELNLVEGSRRKFLTAEEISRDPDFSEVIFRSDSMTNIFNKALIVSEFDVPVLIEGETGTGKEVLAGIIHKKSQRSAKPFVTINCGAIAKDLVESELFGYVKGAFTGANTDKKGFFEVADGGTVFLDEIGDLPAEVQVKILRILNDGSFSKVGSPALHKTDVRVIAATHKTLMNQVTSGNFREDLFYRLAVVRLEIPPLRNRKDDLQLLIKELFARLAPALGATGLNLSHGAMTVLQTHTWQGNTRELINTLQRLIIFASSDVISEEEASNSIMKMGLHEGVTAPTPDSLDVNENISVLFTKLYEAALQTAKSKKEIAKILGFENHQTLDNWVKRYYKKN